MFESLKKLFSKPASPPPPPPPAGIVSNSTAPPAPPPARPAPRPSPASSSAPIPAQIGDAVHLPLNDILAHLPANVAPLLLARPGGTFSLPIRNAVEQLATGAVRVRFAELRQSALPGTFANDLSQDETLIDLPLPQVLAAIGPAAFARRPQQKMAAPPDDVTGVFGPKGVAPAQAASKAAAPASPAAIATAPTPASAPKPALSITPVSPAPTPVPKPMPSIKPVSPAPAAAPAPAPKPLPSIRPVSPVPTPMSAPKPASPLPFSTRPVAAAPPTPKSETPPPAPAAADEATLVFTIGAISQSWPDAIRQEIEQSNLGEATVAIPMSRLDAGMKAGRVVFAWSELIGWLNAPPSAQTSQGAAELEVPLSMVAPVFIGRYRAGIPRKVVSVGQDIPDLFAGLKKSAAAAPAPAPTPAALEPVPPAPAAAAATSHSTLGELFGQPSKDEWTPQEIAQQIAALAGVSGSLLATADGLLVAGQVPPPLNNETLAAFLPQVLGRMSGYSKEVKLGALRAVTISTDSAPCAMFQAGTLYLAVLGKPGQSLPEAVLLQIAAQVAKRNQ